MTSETGWINVAVARVSLSLHALQVFGQFVGSTRDITLGEESDFGTPIVFEPITPVGALDAAVGHGYITTRAAWWWWWWIVQIG